jgi:hypothetical protein
VPVSSAGNIERRNTMSTKLALAAAALVAALAGPALAHQAVRHMPANAYASVGTAPAPLSDRYRGDFQLQGRP